MPMPMSMQSNPSSWLYHILMQTTLFIQRRENDIIESILSLKFCF